MTVRSEGQFNTVVYEDYDLYRGVERRDVILVHPDDIARLGLRAGGRVCVTSEIGEMQNVLVHEFADIKPGNAAMYYPEANALVPRRLDPLSKTPAFKCVIVTVTPMPERTERKSTMSSGNERDLVTIVPPDAQKAAATRCGRVKCSQLSGPWSVVMNGLKLKFAPVVVIFALGCARSGDDEPTSFRPIGNPDLPNAYAIHEKVISGGEPHGEDAFAALAELGVKTVISVDGAKPEVALAKKHGMRYVHLPHSYDGVPEGCAWELAKAVRDLPGPVYLHCHHGKHRSPAAAAVACVGAGLLPQGDALKVLETAGTSKSYRGLYQSAESARKLEDKLLDELKPDFPETADVPPLADAMVALERTHDHVKQVAANGWKALAKHPDIDPAHEVLLLREHYTELLRADEVSGQPAEFRKLMREGEAAATTLQAHDRRGRLWRGRKVSHGDQQELLGVP